MTNKTITILGCGVAGSWIAQHLSSLGCSDFVLYGDYPMTSSLVSKGPFLKSTLSEGNGSSAATLAVQIKSINPASTVEVHEHFEQGKNDDRLRGFVVGELSSMANCMSAFRTAKEQGLQWISLGLPSTRDGTAVVVTDPSELDAAEHLGKPIQSKQEIMVEAAKIAAIVTSALAA
ncbi:hypothetical protein NKH47_12315 [Mesorhizobium sp. M1060]|uniref:hypothetical protein n=1 Tax=Mesorhizobium sp. M1060 TaxID=2957052 RepID=UPI003338BB13